MKKIKMLGALLLTVFTACSFAGKSNTKNESGIMGESKTLHDFKVSDIDGKEFDLASLKGKKVLVVNVASKCGLTPQYEKLQQLYEKYKNQNFVILGFPSNNFMGQEPRTNEEIKEFCALKYDVDFPMMGKISVKGDSIAPLYQWLTKKAKVSWNFQKFMINPDGTIYDFAPPREDPFSDKIINWIEKD